LIEPQAHAQGAILPVQAHAGARRNAVGGIHDGRLKVSVTTAPEKGKANKAIIAVLSERLSLRKSRIELLSGQTSAQKQFLIRGLTPAELAERLASSGS
jgi:uncharacterized protein (TIGR00251 family)